jgi:hypothetical protein
MTNLLNRRAVVRAIPFLAAAGAAPAILTEEVKAAGAEISAEDRRLLHFLKTASPAELAEWHETRLGLNLAKRDGGRWTWDEIGENDGGAHVIMFAQHKADRPSFWRDYRTTAVGRA